MRNLPLMHARPEEGFARHRLLLPALASAFLLASFLGGAPVRAADAARPARARARAATQPSGFRIRSSRASPAARPSDIVQFMREYRSGAWPSSVMGRIAKGFDDQQIDAIAAWFAAQPE